MRSATIKFFALNILNQWHDMADRLRSRVRNSPESLLTDRNLMDALCQGLGAHVMLHSPGEPSPKYVSPNTAGLLGIDRDRMNDRDLLDMAARNLISGLPAWNEYHEHFAQRNSGILQVCVKVSDADGSPHWLCGSCGFLFPDGQCGLVLIVLHDLDHLHTGTQAEQLKDSLLRKLDRLTPREREVLALMAKELSSAEIASTLHLSRHTVTTHRSSIMTKLGAKEVLGLAPYLPLLGHGRS